MFKKYANIFRMQQTRKTLLEKYDVDNATKDKCIREKIIKTNIECYVVTYTF